MANMIPVLKANTFQSSKTGNAWRIGMQRNLHKRVIWIAKSQSELKDGILSVALWLANKELIPAINDGWEPVLSQVVYSPNAMNHSSSNNAVYPKSEIDKGYFTVEDSNGHRTYRFNKWNGRTVVSLMTGTDNQSHYTGFGFIYGKDIQFWRKCDFSEEVRARSAEDIKTIITNPSKTGGAFAMRSNRCSRCGKMLTNPASIKRFLGPECAKLGFLVYGEEPDFSNTLG